MALSENDESFLKRNGYLLPHYLWPEDLWYVDESKYKLKRENATLLAAIPSDLEVEFNLNMDRKQHQLTHLTKMSNF
jgi:hypothetical protein